jgi:hypothetical protein
MSIMLPCSAVTSPFRNSMIGAFRVADGPAVPPGGIVFDGDTWYVSQRDGSGVDLAANLARLVAGAVVTVETPTGSSTLTITGAARAEGNHVVIVGDRVREGAMIAGQETGLWLQTRVASAGDVYVPIVLADVTSRYPGIEVLNMGQVQSHAVYGISGSAQPITMAVGEYVTIQGPTRIHWEGGRWNYGPVYPSGDMTGKWPNVASKANLAALKADPQVGDDGTGSPNDPYGPDEPWAPGSYIGLADLSLAYWDGEAWQAGKAPALPARARLASGGMPGPWLPRGVPAPANEADLRANPPIRSANFPWSEGTWVETADGAKWHWDGATWVAGEIPTTVAATGATAGSPGSWTPPGPLTRPPTNRNAANFIHLTDAAWTTGQYIVCGDNSQLYWDGSAWQEGVAPDPLDLTGEWSQWWGTTPANLAALKANATVGDSGSIVPTGAFTPGQYVTLGDGSKASWDGAAWVAGAGA